MSNEGPNPLTRAAWRIYQLLGPLKRLVPGTLISYWFSTRRFSQLLSGIPALLAIFMLLGCVIYSWRSSGETMTSKELLANAVAARNNGKDAIANLYLKKAKRITAGTPDDQYDQAVLLYSANEPAAAVEIMRKLAPLDQKGHPPARLWLINALQTELVASAAIESPSELQLEARMRLFLLMEQHCAQLLVEEPDNELALERLAMIRLDQRNGEAAVKLLQRLVELNDKHRVTLARALSAAKRTEESKRHAERGVAYHRTQLQLDTLTDTQREQNRFNLGFCLMLNDQYKEAAATLMNGDQVPSDPEFRSLLAEALFRWSETFPIVRKGTGELDEDQLRRRLNLLQTAIKVNKNDPRFLAKLGAIAGVGGEIARQAHALMTSMVQEGEGTSIVHFALGIVEMQAGNSSEALKQFETADKLSPDTPVILNNLAFTQAHGDQPDLDKALALITRAIEINNTVPAFYDTRGGIQLKLQKWTDAIADYEIVLKYGVRGRAAAHEALSTAYEEINDADLAALHREEAEKIRRLQSGGAGN
ncbi:tetratricopeptide repeat protein [Stieleria varia]|uniref:Tetratricopeptide repeat protein n=1 Tax=Stieleria varia TaxID=2528005 RepID=A0A5C6AZR3_9BACT|nr:tetratricopeptide repeat protein [Stieleria varia]TWU04669.1 Tetratricopeptide repeat protein [Stieleria varia]